MKFADWLLERVSEPSTWAGAALVASSVHDSLVHGGGPIAIAQGIFGALAILMKEGTSK